MDMENEVVMNNALRFSLIVAAIGICSTISAFGQSDPKGDGPPDTLACRQPQLGPGHLGGRPVCLKNSRWLELKANRLTVGDDGKSIVHDPGDGSFHGNNERGNDATNSIPGMPH
jgi:hypothetical protein